MIVVVQCAASKRADAGHLRTAAGKRVVFVAQPESAPPDSKRVVARPDDASDNGKTWRDALLDYNNEPANNPLGLLPSYRLYENKTYGRLVDRLGVDRVYILSAGWGLIRADFLTPYYDISFSQSADGYEEVAPFLLQRILNQLPTSDKPRNPAYQIPPSSVERRFLPLAPILTMLKETIESGDWVQNQLALRTFFWIADMYKVEVENEAG